VTEDVYDDFGQVPEGSWINNWNIFSPKWARVQISGAPDQSGNCIMLEDSDPYDYAKSERVFRTGRHVEATFLLMARQTDCGDLHIEMCDGKGSVPLTVIFNSNGEMLAVHGRKHQVLMQYEKGKWYELKIIADIKSSSFDVVLDGNR
jgi:hypothetical protein